MEPWLTSTFTVSISFRESLPRTDAELTAEIAELTAHCQRGDHPLIIASNIGYLISDLLKTDGASLHTAYQLNSHFLSLNQLGYTKPAYPHKAIISTFISWLNQSCSPMSSMMPKP